MAAPLKNTFGAGNHRAGRPAKFQTPGELFQQVSDYFGSLGERRPTITGLCLYLGFTSRQSLRDYANKEAFSYPIRRALLLIEAEYEQLLTGPNPRAAIFALKNMGWSDKVVRTTNTASDKRLAPFTSTEPITPTKQ